MSRCDAPIDLDMVATIQGFRRIQNCKEKTNLQLSHFDLESLSDKVSPNSIIDLDHHKLEQLQYRRKLDSVKMWTDKVPTAALASNPLGRMIMLITALLALV